MLTVSCNSACRKQRETFDDLRPSMKMFSDISNCYEASSDHFSVKITGVQKSEDDFSYQYSYAIAIACTKDEPMRINSIEFCNEKSFDQKLVGLSLPQKLQISDYFENTVFRDKYSSEAFQWIIKKSISKDILMQIDCSEEELDSIMRKINIKIVFNMQEELIEISCDQLLPFEVPFFRGDYMFGVLGEF